MPAAVAAAGAGGEGGEGGEREGGGVFRNTVSIEDRYQSHSFFFSLDEQR